jgi:hypothetical protein
VPEVVSGLLGGEVSNEGADSALEVFNGSLGKFAQMRLEFAEGHLDAVQVW